MAKQISQETFDEVVWENIREFEMEPEAALKDAIESFEAQGVNLSIIVKDAAVYTSGGDGDSESTLHPVTAAVQGIQQTLQAEPLDWDKLKTHLDVLRAECDVDLARRCLAGKSGAYGLLLNALNASDGSSECVALTLNTMISLCCGQPDLLTQDGLGLFCKYLKTYEDDITVLCLLLRLVHFTCIMHEANRQNYVENGLIPLITSILERYNTNEQIVKEACRILRILTADDDVRVPFGKGHEHAKMIVTEGNTFKKILDACQVHKDNNGVLAELFSTLSKLAVRNEFCQEIMDLGALDLLTSVLVTSSMNHQGVTKQVLGLIKSVAGNDDVKVAIASKGGVELILDVMSKHIKQAGIVETGCAAVATVCLRQPAHCNRVMAAKGYDVILKGMQIHPSQVMLQKQGCMVLRQLVSRNPENIPILLENGAEGVVRQVYNTHKPCHDEAKAALRDLGCDVHLTCLWLGEGKGISA